MPVLTRQALLVCASVIPQMYKHQGAGFAVDIMPAFNIRPENYTIQHRKQIAALLEEAADIMTIKLIGFYEDQQRINEIRNTLSDDYNFALGAYRWPDITIVYEFKEVQVLFVLLVAAAVRAGDVLTS